MCSIITHCLVCELHKVFLGTISATAAFEYIWLFGLFVGKMMLNLHPDLLE